MRKKQGVVPVIAVVILIAVAVAIGIAVAFWASGLIGTLGKVEKLDIREEHAETVTGGWNIVIAGENTGTTEVTIVDVTIDGKPLSDYSSSSATFMVGTESYTYNNGISVPLAPGESFSATIHIDGGFTSGQMIEVDIVTGSGVVFKRTLILP